MNKRNLLFSGIISASLVANAQLVIDKSHLDVVKSELSRPIYSRAYSSLLGEADNILTADADAISADTAVSDLALAWYLSGDARYADKAVAILNNTFLNKKTMVSPDSQEAASLNLSGIIDGVSLLSGSKGWTAKKDKELKKWLTAYVDHFGKNNEVKGCGIRSASSLMAASLYIGKKEVADNVLAGLNIDNVKNCCAPGLVDIIEMGKKSGCQGVERLYGALNGVKETVSKGNGLYVNPKVEEKKQYALEALWRAGKSGNKLEYVKTYEDNRVFNPESRFILTAYSPDDVDDAFAHAELSLRQQIDEAKRASRKENNRKGHRMNPHSIHKDGEIRLNESTEWTSGFFPGELWIMYDFTRNPYWREEAATFTWAIEDAKTYGGTHDLGFMFNDSFEQGWELTGERSYFDVAHQAAKTLTTRYSPKVGLIRSWDHNREVWKYPVIIDNMMNLELLFNMSKLTGNEEFANIARSHADNTLKNHFRPDHSSYHVVDYDPETGDVRMKVTAQGYRDDSFWSRGQGWGLYGFTMCYRYTKDPRYLDHAKGIADFIINYENMPSDGVPYWDMMAPGSEIKDNPEVPRDASAGALMASALYELAGYVDAETSARYLGHADKILSSLSTGNYTIAPDAKRGFILDHSTGSKPHNSEVDVPLVYADFYYLQALNRKRKFKR